MKDEIKEESKSHDCPIGGISLRVLTKEEAESEDRIEKLADILAEEEVKRKPDASDVRDTLITGYCQECPDHDEYDCADHECFIWNIFGVLMDAEE